MKKIVNDFPTQGTTETFIILEEKMTFKNKVACFFKNCFLPLLQLFKKN
jgi:hypothetical protein